MMNDTQREEVRQIYSEMFNEDIETFKDIIRDVVDEAIDNERKSIVEETSSDVYCEIIKEHPILEKLENHVTIHTGTMILNNVRIDD